MWHQCKYSHKFNIKDHNTDSSLKTYMCHIFIWSVIIQQLCIHINTNDINRISLYPLLVVKTLTYDPVVWGSIPANSGHVSCEIYIEFYIVSGHDHPWVMGTSWNENRYCVNGFSCRKCAAFSPRRLECDRMNSTTWRNWCKVHWVYHNILPKSTYVTLP